MPMYILRGQNKMMKCRDKECPYVGQPVPDRCCADCLYVNSCLGSCQLKPDNCGKCIYEEVKNDAEM